ncbi:hypothetical protein [Ferrovum myxofaciens]
MEVYMKPVLGLISPVFAITVAAAASHDEKKKGNIMESDNE